MSAKSRRYRQAHSPRAAPAPRASPRHAPARLRRRGCEALGELLEDIRGDVGGAVLDMLSEKIGMDLLADAQPGAHQRDADLRAAEPHDLDIGGKRRRPREIGVGQRDDNDGQKVNACPIDCRITMAMKSPSAQSCVSWVPSRLAAAKADRPMISTMLRVDMPEQEDRQRHQHEHRQRAIDHQQHAGLFGAQQADGGEKIRHQR